MIEISLPGKAIGNIFAPKPQPLPQPPPPPPTPEDPAVLASKEAVRMQERRKKGRAAMNMTGPEGVLGEANVTRPEAGAQLLGN